MSWWNPVDIVKNVAGGVGSVAKAIGGTAVNITGGVGSVAKNFGGYVPVIGGTLEKTGGVITGITDVAKKVGGVSTALGKEIKSASENYPIELEPTPGGEKTGCMVKNAYN